MKKVYYIWGPKYIGGELNGPDLIAGVTLTEDRRLVFIGRNPQLMLDDFTIAQTQGLRGDKAELLFHLIVDKEVPQALQLAYKNASKEESAEFISSL